VVIAAVALSVGWILLSTYQVLERPSTLFVLGTLVLGLMLPAIVLTARESGRAGVWALLRDTVRIPPRVRWLPLSVLALPFLVWCAAAALAGARPITADLLIDFSVQLVTGALIINIWEEMVWTGFVQRRAMARWGTTTGSVATAVLFAGIHLPLAFDGAGTPGDVAVGVGILIGTGIGLRLLIARVDCWSGRSLLTVGLLHASFNTSASLIEPSHDWIRIAVTGLVGLVVYAVGVGRHSVHLDAPMQHSEVASADSASRSDTQRAEGVRA
jgi:membrane protease YdiL (CAAX protease family)